MIGLRDFASILFELFLDQAVSHCMLKLFILSNCKLCEDAVPTFPSFG